jgi:hypothetical protein
MLIDPGRSADCHPEPCPGTITVLDRLGRRPSPHAVNPVPTLRAPPLLAGDRLVLVGEDAVHCVRDAAAGLEPAEAERVLASVLGALAEPWPSRDAPTIEPLPDPRAIGDAPVWPMNCSQSAPGSWLVAGPVPQDRVAGKLVPADRPQPLLPRLGGTVVAGADDVVFARYDGGGRYHSSSRSVEALYHRNVVREQVHFRQISLQDARVPSHCWLASYLDVGRRRLLKVQFSGIGTAVWLGGRPVADGQIIRLLPGRYAVILRVPSKTMPPQIANRVVVSFALSPVAEIDQLHADWLALARERWYRLVELLDAVPSLAADARVARVLAALDETVFWMGE